MSGAPRSPRFRAGQPIQRGRCVICDAWGETRTRSGRWACLRHVIQADMAEVAKRQTTAPDAPGLPDVPF